MTAEEIISLLKYRRDVAYNGVEEMHEKDNSERADELLAIGNEIQDILNEIESRS